MDNGIATSSSAVGIELAVADTGIGMTAEQQAKLFEEFTQDRRRRRRCAHDAERPMSNARGKSPGAPKGNKNAFKHGRYTAEAIERRRGISALPRVMKALARDR